MLVVVKLVTCTVVSSDVTGLQCVLGGTRRAVSVQGRGVGRLGGDVSRCRAGVTSLSGAVCVRRGAVGGRRVAVGRLRDRVMGGGEEVVRCRGAVGRRGAAASDRTSRVGELGRSAASGSTSQDSSSCGSSSRGASSSGDSATARLSVSGFSCSRGANCVGFGYCDDRGRRAVLAVEIGCPGKGAGRFGQSILFTGNSSGSGEMFVGGKLFDDIRCCAFRVVRGNGGLCDVECWGEVVMEGLVIAFLVSVVYIASILTRSGRTANPAVSTGRFRDGFWCCLLCKEAWGSGAQRGLWH